MEYPYKARFRDYKPSVITFFNRDGNVLLREPSLVATDTEMTIQAVGKDAEKLTGHDLFIVGSPLRYGVVADFDLTSAMFKAFLKKVGRYSTFIRPNIAACVPIELTEVETRALKEMLFHMGAKNVLIAEKPFEQVIQVLPPKFKVIIEITPEMD